MTYSKVLGSLWYLRMDLVKRACNDDRLRYSPKKRVLVTGYMPASVPQRITTHDCQLAFCTLLPSVVLLRKEESFSKLAVMHDHSVLVAAAVLPRNESAELLVSFRDATIELKKASEAQNGPKIPLVVFVHVKLTLAAICLSDQG